MHKEIVEFSALTDIRSEFAKEFYLGATLIWALPSAISLYKTLVSIHEGEPNILLGVLTTALAGKTGLAYLDYKYPEDTSIDG